MRQPEFSWADMIIGMIMLVLVLFTFGCADTIFTDLSGLSDRSFVVSVLDANGIEEVCGRAYKLPGSQSCVLIARNPEEAKAITAKWIAGGGLISCIIATPPNSALLLHEATLCGNYAEGYWHTSKP